MSEYVSICVNKLSLMWFRNYVNADIVSLFFSKKDLCITPDCKMDLEEEEDVKYTKYEYMTTVKKAKERLDARGFGISNLEKIFNSTFIQAIDYSAFLYHLGVDFDELEQKAMERCKKMCPLKNGKMQCTKSFLMS